MSKIRWNFSLKNRSISFYLSLISVLIAFVGGLTFFIIDKMAFQGKTNFTDNSHLTLIYLLLAAIIGTINLFIEFSSLNMIVSILYGVGIGQHFFLTMFPWADVFKGVPFFVSDQISVNFVYNTFLTFLLIFIVGGLFSIVSCFLFKKAPKSRVEIKA